jgi:hypothetical protein
MHVRVTIGLPIWLRIMAATCGGIPGIACIWNELLVSHSPGSGMSGAALAAPAIAKVMIIVAAIRAMRDFSLALHHRYHRQRR